jgi:REP element-mobilizing transposase RayT
MRLFAKERDFEGFEEIIGQAKERLPMRVLAWCVMSTHWHFVLWPREDGDLSEFMRSAHGDAYAALARGASDGGNRPAVPGPLQVVPDSGRRPSLALPFLGAGRLRWSPAFRRFGLSG